MSRLTRDQRLLFIGLFSNADDQGRIKGHPLFLRSAIFPYDNIPEDQIKADLAAIESIGSVHVYEIDGMPYIQIAGWWKYQSPQWAYPSPIQPPTGWTDRLRYRKDGHVHTQNWDTMGGFLGNDTPGPLGNALGKEPDDEQVKLQYRDRDSDSNKIDGGADAPPANLNGWLELMHSSKNRPASLRWMFETLYPGRDPPDYGYLGRTAKTVGGAGRLAALLWQSQACRVDGDVLRYCMGIAKGNGRKSNLAAAQAFLEELEDGEPG